MSDMDQAVNTVAGIFVLHQRIAALEAEIAELRAYLETQGKSEEAADRFYVEIKRIMGEGYHSLEECLPDIEKLRKDRARLDWLQTQEGCVRGTDVSKWSVAAEDESVSDVRQAIDAAMEAELEIRRQQEVAHRTVIAEANATLKQFWTKR